MYLTWGECDDRHRKCSHWRSRGLCEKKAKRMDRWCPWACHKCVPEKLGEIYIYMQSIKRIQDCDGDTPREHNDPGGGGVTWVNVCWVLCRWPLRAPTPL